MILYSQIPNKSLFKIEEVCELCQIKPYVLRFWDTEFEQIQSVINSAGKKMYQKKDILIISILRDLLFERKLTIEKARFELAQVDFSKLIYSAEENSTLIVDQTNDDKIIGENITDEKPVSIHSIQSLSSESIEKIDAAKEKLQSVLTKIDQLKHTYNWF